MTIPIRPISKEQYDADKAAAEEYVLLKDENPFECAALSRHAPGLHKFVPPTKAQELEKATTRATASPIVAAITGVPPVAPSAPIDPFTAAYERLHPKA